MSEYRDMEQLRGMLEIERRASAELRADIERLRRELNLLRELHHSAEKQVNELRAALDDCIHGRRDWMEKAKRALDR